MVSYLAAHSSARLMCRHVHHLRSTSRLAFLRMLSSSSANLQKEVSTILISDPFLLEDDDLLIDSLPLKKNKDRGIGLRSLLFASRGLGVFADTRRSSCERR